ncbi:hypothetical protein [Ruficoccus sp. ZRK36]|uniref:type II secretion system protein n=1 Tax=Ruficoccus sp. ZRK36 TaxID=2866311 RepID=UPI001C72B6C6|nr:hypothetical protein [Ruficoccus sp. ZRK36]QYY34449.1 hypothetical protein K0V07_09010 [Ruficoccus sp. ZRK36]
MEMLVCLAVVGVLTSLTFTVVHKAGSYADMSNEVSAARRLIGGFHLYSQDHSGRFMPGLDRTVSSIAYRDRQVSFAEAPHRYPFRIAPYLNYELDGAIFVNGNREQIEEMYGTSGSIHDYIVSLWPAFGMNMFFVGGKVDGAGDLMVEQQNDVISRQSQMEDSIIVFASGGLRASAGMNVDDDILGYHEVRAPHTWSSMGWKESSNPGEYGNVAFRHDGKAVCAFLDGSVQTMKAEELRDMRLWSSQAARRNDPGYRPSN